MTKLIYALIALMLPLFAYCAEDPPKVLLAILARNKAHALPRYLDCIDHLDYPKKQISVYINTNNNEDDTLKILTDWAEQNKAAYGEIVFESHDVDGASSTRPHEWTAERFHLLATIRNKSMAKTKECGCDYYFVVDCDNFIAPSTLKTLVSKEKPIIAPLLKAVPEKNDCYSNYFCAVSETGYYASHPDYFAILQGTKKGTFKVPVVHCTYLIDGKVIDRLGYIDGTKDYEFVIFSRTARAQNIDQYICNEEDFGTLLHFFEDISLAEEVRRTREHFEAH